MNASEHPSQQGYEPPLIKDTKPDFTTNHHEPVILGKSSVGKSYLAQAMVNAACRRGYTARYYRLDDLANTLAVYHRTDPERMAFLRTLHDCDALFLDDFLTTPITPETASELLNILAARENRGSTVVSSQFDPEDWYKSLHDAVIAESILNRIV